MKPKQFACQNCDLQYDKIRDFKVHVRSYHHKMAVAKLFHTVVHRGPVYFPVCVVLDYLRNPNESGPLIGLDMVTLFITPKKYGSFYICHVCEKQLSARDVIFHLCSEGHYFKYLSYSNPDLLRFAWLNDSFSYLESSAMNEKSTNGCGTLRIFELTEMMLKRGKKMSYHQVMTMLSGRLFQRVMAGRPPRKTFQAYLRDPARTNPLLGLNSLLEYSCSENEQDCGYLCLLCKTKLKAIESISHCLSFVHVYAHLKEAYPAMIDFPQNTRYSYDLHKKIFSLATRAQNDNPPGELQVMNLDVSRFKDIDSSGYDAALDKLQLIKREGNQSELTFAVAAGVRNPFDPEGQTASATIDSSAKQTAEKTHVHAVPSYEKNSQNNSSQCVEESGPSTFRADQISLEGLCTETTKMVKMGSQSPQLAPKCSEPPKPTGSANLHPAFVHPVESSSLPSSFQATALVDLTPASSPLPVPTSLQQCDLQQKDAKDTNQVVHKPAKAKELCQTLKHHQPQDTGSLQMQTKKRILEESLQSPNHGKNETQAVSQVSSTCAELWNYLRTTNREPVIGLSSVIECNGEDQPPFYVCTTCKGRFSEKSIIKHLTSYAHQNMYLKAIGCVPLLGKKKPKSKWLRTQAIMIERSRGYGEAQVLDLKANDFHEILNGPILNALGKLRDLLHNLISNDDDKSTLADSSLVEYSSNESCGSKVPKKVDEMEEKDTGVLTEAVKAEYSYPVPVSDEATRSSPHLWSYLTSPTRTEPVIGLSMITEYRTSTQQNSFLCSCCKIILSTSSYMAHLISPKHRYNYIKSKHLDLVELWGEKFSLTGKIAELRAKAKILQDHEGWGCIKVVEKESLKKKDQEERTSTEQQDQKRVNLTKVRKKKTTKLSAMIGLNLVTRVTDGKKKLFFCELCSVRCHFDHLCSVTHRKNYLEHKYPGWTASGLNMEKKLHKIAVRLAAVERSTGIGMKKLTVDAKVFTALITAPFSAALSKLQLLQTNSDVDVKQSTSSSALQTSHDAVSDYMRDEVHSNTTCLVDPCSHSSVSMSSCPSISTVHRSLHPHDDPSSPHSPCTNLLAPDRLYSPISPPPPPSTSPASASLTLSIPGPPPLSSQAASQCQSSPTAPHNPPVPLQPAAACQDFPHVAHSSTLPISANPSVSLPTHSAPSCVSSDSNLTRSFLIGSVTACSTAPYPSFLLTKPQSSCAEWRSRDRSQPVCRQSILAEENRLPAIIPPYTYTFPNLPTVAGQSRVSAFLSVSNTEPVIGLPNILECRKIPNATFFLCLNCAEHVSKVDICGHITSERHQYHSIRSQYPEIFQEWQWKTVSNLKIPDLAERLALLEKPFDAKVIILNQKQYEHLRSAEFHDAIRILQQMYGPEQKLHSPVSYFAGQIKRNRETCDARAPQDYVEADREACGHQLQQNCNLSSSQKTKGSLHTSQVHHSDLDSRRGDFGKSSVVCSPSIDEPQASESLWNADTQAEETHPLHQSKSQTGLTAESDGRDSSLHSLESRSERTMFGCANSPALQTPLTSTQLQPGPPAYTFPCVTTIKQEKPDQVDLSHETHCFGSPNREAPSSSQATVSPVKQPTNLKKYVTSKRAAPDAVVGLSSVIQCISEENPPLYLCLSCSSKLNHDLIINHVVKCGHRNNYLRARYPWLIEDWYDSDIRTQSRKLMWLAHMVETEYEDEPGQLQEMKMECADLEEIKGMTFEKAILQLQKIRKKQNLYALQTCISPKIKKNLVKQEKVETEVTSQQSQELPDFNETFLQQHRTASKHKAAEPSLVNTSLPELKISGAIQSRTLSSENVVVDRATIPNNKDLAKSTKPNQKSFQQTKSKVQAKVKPEGLIQASSKATLNDYPLKAHISDLHYGKLVQDVPPNPSKKMLKITLADESPGHCTSKKVDAQLRNPASTKKVPKPRLAATNVLKSDTGPMQTLGAAQLQTTAQTSKASSINDIAIPKQIQVITKSDSSQVTKIHKKISYSITTQHLKRSSSIEITCAPSEFPVKKSKHSDSLSQVQKEASILPTVRSDDSPPSQFVPLPSKEPNLPENCAIHCTTAPGDSSLALHPSSQTCKKATSSDPLDKTVHKTVVVVNSQLKELSSTLTPQQKQQCHSNTGTISVPSVELQGLEIARLPDRRPMVAKRSNENAWNYENRQFSSETHAAFSTSVVANSSSETVAIKEHYLLLSQQKNGNKQNPDFDWKISGNGCHSFACPFTENDFNTTASTISYPTQTDNINANLYLSMASGCVPAAPDISPGMYGYALPNQFSGLSQSNPAYASNVYQTQPVYQSFQHPEMDDPYYGFYVYNQAVHPNQTATGNESVTPSASAQGHYSPAEWEQTS